MPETIETTVYLFSELSDSAKEKARDWYRQGALDYSWYDGVYEDATECGKLMGITIDKIWFSGFSSQGDGACFDGSYAYAEGAAKAIKAHAPQDTKLHEIADRLQFIQRKHFYAIEATSRHSGHYYHAYCTSIEVTDSRKQWGDIEAYPEEFVTDCLRDFMRWIYRQLETQYDYLMSNENVDETIAANCYTFTVEGRRFG